MRVLESNHSENAGGPFARLHLRNHITLLHLLEETKRTFRDQSVQTSLRNGLAASQVWLVKHNINHWDPVVLYQRITSPFYER